MTEIKKELEFIRKEREYDTMAISANITKTNQYQVVDIMEKMGLEYDETIELLLMLGAQKLFEEMRKE